MELYFLSTFIHVNSSINTRNTISWLFTVLVHLEREQQYNFEQVELMLVEKSLSLKALFIWSNKEMGNVKLTLADL